MVCFRRSSQVPDDSLPWLLSVAHKILANHFRAQRRQNALNGKLFDLASPVEHFNDAEPIAASTPMIDAYRGLPPTDREVLRLVVLQGMNYEETARALGITRKAVYGRYARALDRLKDLLPAPPL